MKLTKKSRILLSIGALSIGGLVFSSVASINNTSNIEPSSNLDVQTSNSTSLFNNNNEVFDYEYNEALGCAVLGNNGPTTYMNYSPQELIDAYNVDPTRIGKLIFTQNIEAIYQALLDSSTVGEWVMSVGPNGLLNYFSSLKNPRLIKHATLGSNSLAFDFEFSPNDLNIPSVFSEQPIILTMFNTKTNTSTSPIYDDSKNPYKDISLSSIYPYAWIQEQNTIQDYIYNNLSKLFNGVSGIQKSNVIIKYSAIQVNNVDGSVTIPVYFTKWNQNGTIISGISPTWKIKITGFNYINLANGDGKETTYSSYFKFKPIANDTIAGLALNELTSVKADVANGDLLDANELSILSKYLYFGPLPTELNDFKLSISGTADNLNGRVDLVITCSSVFGSSSLTNAQVVQSNDSIGMRYVISSSSITNCSFISTITELTNNVINVNEIVNFGVTYTAINFINELKNNTNLQIVIKDEIINRLFLKANPTDSWYQKKYYKSTDIDFGSFEPISINVGSGIIELEVNISNYITIDSLETKPVKFIFVLEAYNDPSIVKNTYYPSLMTINEAIQMIQEDINSKNNFYEQTFIQQFVTLNSLNPKSTKVIKEQHTINGQALSLTLTFSNFPIYNQQTGTIEYGNKDVTFDYLFQTNANATSLPLTITTATDLIVDFYGIQITYPYAFELAQDVTKMKTLILEQINNKAPETTIEHIDIGSINLAKPSEGSLSVDVKLTRYKKFNENTNSTEIIDNPNNPLTQTVTFKGLKKAYADTILSRNDAYMEAYGTEYQPESFKTYFESISSYSEKIEVIKKFVKIYNHPFTTDGNIDQTFDQLFGTSETNAKLKLKMEILYANNQESKLTARISANYAFQDNNNNPSNNICFEEFDFYFLKSELQSTTLLDDVYDNDSIYQSYSAWSAYQLINSKQYDSVEYQTLLTRMINIIVANGFKFLPEDFSQDILQNIKSIEAIDYDNVNKTLQLKIELNYYKENGQIITPEDAKPKEFYTTFHANFRDIQETRIKDNLRLFIPNLENNVASEWFNQNGISALTDFLFSKYEDGNNNPQVIVGDIPSNFEKTNVIADNNTIEFDDKRGEIRVELSLTNYWDYVNGNPEMVNNQNGYSPKTTVVFYGFLSEGITILPSGSYKVPTAWENYLPSEFNKNEEFTLNLVKQYVFDNLIKGEKQYLSYTDISDPKNNANIYNISYTANPNDQNGELEITFKMNKMWIFGEDGNTEITERPSDTEATFTIVLTNLKKRAPTTFNTSIDMAKINSDYGLKAPNEITDEILKLIIENNIIAGDFPPNDSINPSYTYQRVNDNGTGTIKLILTVNRYYHEGDALLYDVYNKGSETLEPKIIEITLNNLLQTTPTKFINSDYYEIDTSNYGSLVLQNPYQVSNIIKNNSNQTYLNQLYQMIYQELIVSGKQRIDPLTDIKLEPIEHDNKAGTIKISISLTKYWDQNGEFVDVNTNPSKQPLTHVITLGTFAKTNPTIVEDNKTISVSGTSLSLLYPNQFVNKYHSDSNIQLDSKKLIWNNAISGYIEDMSYDDVNIIDVTQTQNDIANNSVTISFKLHRYWNENGEFVTDNQSGKTYKVIFIGFQSNSATKIIEGPHNIVQKKYNEYGNYFGQEPETGAAGEHQFAPNNNVQEKTVEQWIEEVKEATGITNDQEAICDQLKAFMKWNWRYVIINPPTNVESQINIDPQSISWDNKTGTITFKVTLNKIINNDGNEVDWGSEGTPIENIVKINGFLEVGETTYSDLTQIDISGDLLNYVNANKIVSSDVTFIDNVLSPEGIEENLKKFIRDNLVTGYAPMYDKDPNKNITWENIIIKRISKQDNFSQSLEIEFTLNRYYDENGECIDGLKPEYKVITLSNFYQSPSSGETIFGEGNYTIGSFDDNGIIDNYFIDETTGKPNYFSNVFEVGSSDPVTTPEQAKENLRKWIFDVVVTGNDSGLTYEDVKIYNPNNFQLLDGTITIQYSLNKYWSTTGPINQSSKIYTIVIDGFKTIEPTSINNNQIYNLIDQTNYTLPDFAAESPLLSAQQVIDAIKTKSYKEISNDSNLLKSLQKYILAFVNLNSSKIFNNLPEDFLDYQDQIEIGVISNGSDGKISVNFKLKYYINENGKVIGPNDETKPLDFSLTFDGFFNAETTKLKNNNITIDISKNGVVNPNNPSEYFNELYTEYSNGEVYYWKNSTTESLINDIVNNSNNEFSRDDAENNFRSVISNWIYQNNIIGFRSDWKDAIDVPYFTQIQKQPLQGIVELKYKVTYGYANIDGSIQPSNINLEGTIILKGFIPEGVQSDFSSTIAWFTIGGISLGILCLLIIILVIVYRRKRDIEYRQ